MLIVGAPAVQCLGMVPSPSILQTCAYSPGLARVPACFTRDLLPVFVARHHAQHCPALFLPFEYWQ